MVFNFSKLNDKLVVSFSKICAIVAHYKSNIYTCFRFFYLVFNVVFVFSRFCSEWGFFSTCFILHTFQLFDSLYFSLPNNTWVIFFTVYFVNKIEKLKTSVCYALVLFFAFIGFFLNNWLVYKFCKLIFL